MLKFSVLMSLYKNEKPEYLRRALDSMLNQTLLPNEILIVKDGVLTDELEFVLEEYKFKSDLFRFLSYEQNRGLGLALRDGVVACKYEYIARMDTDDIADSRRFEIQMDFLEKNPEVALVGSNSQEFDVDCLQPYAVSIMPCSYLEILSFAKKRNPFRHPTIIFKKSAILDSGNYSDFMWFEDYDLFVRVIKKGYMVANLPEYLVLVRADINQFARRGGFEYLKQDLKFQRFLLEIQFISNLEFINNIIIRSVVRLMPNWFRVWFYKKILRK